MPHGPRDFLGLIDVRGHLLRLFDAACRLGVKRNSPAPDDPQIIAMRGSDNRQVALLVDEVLDLIEIDDRSSEFASVDRIPDGPIEKIVRSGETLYRVLRPEAAFADAAPEASGMTVATA